MKYTHTKKVKKEGKYQKLQLKKHHKLRGKNVELTKKKEVFMRWVLVKKTHSWKLITGVTNEHASLPNSSISNSHTFNELWSIHLLKLQLFGSSSSDVKAPQIFELQLSFQEKDERKRKKSPKYLKNVAKPIRKELV